MSVVLDDDDNDYESQLKMSKTSKNKKKEIYELTMKKVSTNKIL